MKMPAVEPLQLGPEVVRRLIPHRPPLLLVDAIEAFSFAPAIEATKLVSASDPVFAGHFPDLWLWPGAYTIEGLAQTCALMGSIIALDEFLKPQDRRAPDVLRELQRGIAELRREPAADPESLRAASRAGAGLLAAVDVKLVKPVFAGSVLTFRAARTHVVGPMVRFDVEASVAGATVAKGTITAATRADG